MQIHLNPSAFLTSPALKDHLVRRLSSAFASARHKIAAISIRLSDLNGPRGGRDKLCQISVTMPGHAEIVIKDVEEDIYAAVDGAIKRAAYRATQMLKRRSKDRNAAEKSARLPYLADAAPA